MPESVPVKKIKKPKSLSMGKKNPSTKSKIKMNTLSKKGKYVKNEKPGTKGPKRKLGGRFGHKGGKKSKSESMPTLRPKPGVMHPKTHADRALKKLTSDEGWG